MRTCGIADECFDRFFGAMAQDLTQTTYETWDDLLGYMDGSAAVIGEMMLPVLRARFPDALGPARALGLAFQLTNFLRDVGEDLDRGVYVPQEDLRHFGADPCAAGHARVARASRASRSSATAPSTSRPTAAYPCSALVGAVRVRCTHALRPHPRAHRGS